jgi:hypothetical protein
MCAEEAAAAAPPLPTLLKSRPLSSSDPAIATTYSKEDTKRSENLIFVDWDDTLCPTTFVSNDFAAPEILVQNPRTECWEMGAATLQKLQQHAASAACFLRQAARLGQVYIITMADKSWLEVSMRLFMPSLESLLKELNVHMVYARTALPSKVLHSRFEDGLADFSKALKTAAMRSVIESLRPIKHKLGARVQPKQLSGDWCSVSHPQGYLKKSSRHWQNIVSIGDSEDEMYAVQDVTFNNKQLEKCGCKAIKLMDQPSLETLTAQLQELSAWLPTIVAQNGDIDLDFSI